MRLTTLLLALLFVISCKPVTEPEEELYVSYYSYLNATSDTVSYRFYGWPPTLDSFRCDKGICRVIDNREFIIHEDTFSLFRYAHVAEESSDTTLYYFHHGFGNWRGLVFIKQIKADMYQMIIDSLQFHNSRPLYDIIEFDTTGYFLHKDEKVNSIKHLEETFL